MIDIVEVKTKAQRRKFVEFPNKLYKDVPEYVPALYSDELSNMDPEINPAFDYCEMRFWLAMRDGKIVGRVAGIINKAANEKWQQKRIRVSRIDFIDDFEVSKTLVGTVEKWGRENGLTEIVGPIGYCDFDRQGMLIDGFDRLSMFITYYNFPYYVTHFEKLGFEKDVDWLENLVYTDKVPEKMDKVEHIADRVVERLGVTVKFLKRKSEIPSYVEKILGLVNSEFKNIYGVVDLPPRQMRFYAKQFVPLLNLDYLVIVEKDEEVVAFGLLAPSLAKAMKKCGGHLFPFGWIGVLSAIKNPKVLDMYSVAVRSDYRKTGLPAVLINEIVKKTHENGVMMAETGPELEYNYNIRGVWEGFKMEEAFKRRRCWKKGL